MKDGVYTSPVITTDAKIEAIFENPAVVKHNVEIIAGEGGKVTHEGEELSNDSKVAVVKDGEQITISILAYEGYDLGKVLFNDNDVTAEVKDGVYTTPAITADGKIEVTFNEYSGINDAESEGIRVYATKGMIVIEGAEGTIDVSTMLGAKAASVAATSTVTKIAVSGNAYIVRVAGKSFKVIL